MIMAACLPAMLVFPLNKAVMERLKDGLDCCCSSISPCHRVYCSDIEHEETFNLSLLRQYRNSHGHVVIYHLGIKCILSTIFPSQVKVFEC